MVHVGVECWLTIRQYVRPRHIFISGTIKMRNKGMKLLIGKTLWGVDAHPGNWDEVFAKIKAEGYEAVECVPVFSFRSDAVLFKQLLAKHDLKLIVQVHTNGGYFKDGAYIYCLNSDKEQHLESFESQVKEALEMGAFLINTHSGHDSWSLDTAVSYFESALEIEQNALKDPAYSHVTIVHETHRQRLMYSPFQTRDILKQPQLKNLKINADLSHWVCVCERVFDLNDSRDASWWPEVLDLVSEHCHFIHARVGHAEGPQVFDPRDNIWSTEIESHLQWWETIWEAQSARGMAVSVVEPEHGPAPYQQYDAMPLPGDAKSSLPQTDMDSILWDINSHVKGLVENRYKMNQSEA